jgi:signal transduction histidine kinase
VGSNTLREFFAINRPLVLFGYGLTFFTLGLAIFLQSRRYSRLRLARDLRWLAAFGILHGLHEWGDIFIPLQVRYLPLPYEELLRMMHLLLLALSFSCLMMFGATTLDERWPHAKHIVIGITVFWGVMFWITFYITPTFEAWHHLASIWARYLLGLPGSLLAAYGLRYQADRYIAPLDVKNIYQVLRFAGFALAAYAIFGGLFVIQSDFFPANVLNKETFEQVIGIPIEVFRSIAGLVLAVSMIRVLEIFEIEQDRLIEGIEAERIQLAERERIGQEIHDGAIQSMYSTSLILESLERHIRSNPDEAIVRLDKANRVLNSAIGDLRRYMESLRTGMSDEPLIEGLHRLATDPRFSSLLKIELRIAGEPTLKAIQVGHVLGIVQEALSNAVRHADAQHVTITLDKQVEGWCLRIEDDGQGFDEKQISPGFGLRTIRDRARLVGGKLDIHSRPSKGTSLTLLILEGNNL